jgi:hypothetical protein
VFYKNNLLVTIHFLLLYVFSFINSTKHKGNHSCYIGELNLIKMTKPHIANLLNALILIGLGTWSYLESSTPSVTALIPAAFGFVLVLLNRGLKNENKLIAHVVVVLTFLVLIGLIKPLLGSISRNNDAGIARVIIMMIASFYALISFVMSFIAARKNRSNG